jgi:NAD+ synthase
MAALDGKAFAIDAERYASVIAQFIAAAVADLSRTGVLVPISGGLDSSVVAALSVKAVGKEAVTGILLPEKQGNPEAQRYANLIATSLGIETRTIDISKALAALGAYDFALSHIPGRRLKARLVRSFNRGNQILELNRGTAGNLTRRGAASFFIKQRVRLVATYEYAEERNLLVCGSAHKSEDLVGLFVKFGVDDVADVMPLKHLYRTQILQLGEQLGLPAEILSRSPNPDVIPGVTDKYRDILGIDSARVDLILLGIERGMESGEIAAQTGVPEKDVATIEELVRVTAHMRNPSLAPVFE